MGIGQLERAQPEREFFALSFGISPIDGELRRHVGDLCNRVVHDFGHEPAREVVRIKACIGGILAQRFAGTLISFGLQNKSHQCFEIELLVSEKFGHG